MEEVRDFGGKLVCMVEPKKKKVEIVKGRYRTLIQFLTGGKIKTVNELIKKKSK